MAQPAGVNVGAGIQVGAQLFHQADLFAMTHVRSSLEIGGVVKWELDEYYLNG
ncbi:MAG: hypothetical protein VXY65_00745 [Actinomycetota bacterium]|nr:hypothetical protein [Actinomycetota bacterium]